MGLLYYVFCSELHMLLVTVIALGIYKIVLCVPPKKNRKLNKMQSDNNILAYVETISELRTEYCHSCGEKMPKDVLVCPHCGYRQTQAAALAEKKAAKKITKGRSLIARILVGAILAIGMLLPVVCPVLIVALDMHVIMSIEIMLIQLLIVDGIVWVAVLVFRRIQTLRANLQNEE